MREKFRDGYTLIELMVVMAIVGILFTIGYTNFQDYSRQQTLLSVVRTLQTDINSTREFAIAGNKPNGCNGLLNGYQFNVISSSTYVISANCTPNNNIEIKQISVAQGVILTPSNPNPVIFKSVAGGTNIQTGANATIIITQTLSGNSKSIIIGANGNVK